MIKLNQNQPLHQRKVKKSSVLLWKQQREEKMEAQREESAILNVVEGGRPTTGESALLYARMERHKDIMAQQSEASESKLLWDQQQDLKKQGVAAEALEYERAGDADFVAQSNEMTTRDTLQRGIGQGMGMFGELSDAASRGALATPVRQPTHPTGAKHMDARRTGMKADALRASQEARRGRTEDRLVESGKQRQGGVLTFYQALRTAKDASKTTDPITGVTKYGSMDELVKAAKELMQMAQSDAAQSPQAAEGSGVSGMTTEQIEARLAEIRSRGQ